MFIELAHWCRLGVWWGARRGWGGGGVTNVYTMTDINDHISAELSD